MSKSFPEATCSLCGSVARIVKHQTFSYFFCGKCKDETPVRLSTQSMPKGRVSEYELVLDTDIIIDKPGIYKLYYEDGSFEWYEHGTQTRRLVIRRTTVRSADRLADSDMPSRKPLLSVSTSSEGAQPQGQSLRSVSDAPNCIVGSETLQTFIDDQAALIQDTIISMGNDYITFRKSAIYVSIDGPIYVIAPGAMWDVDESNKCVQHRGLPPDDTL